MGIAGQTPERSKTWAWSSGSLLGGIKKEGQRERKREGTEAQKERVTETQRERGTETQRPKERRTGTKTGGQIQRERDRGLENKGPRDFGTRLDAGRAFESRAVLSLLNPDPPSRTGG